MRLGLPSAGGGDKRQWTESDKALNHVTYHVTGQEKICLAAAGILGLQWSLGALFGHDWTERPAALGVLANGLLQNTVRVAAPISACKGKVGLASEFDVSLFVKAATVGP